MQHLDPLASVHVEDIDAAVAEQKEIGFGVGAVLRFRGPHELLGSVAASVRVHVDAEVLEDEQILVVGHVDAHERVHRVSDEELERWIFVGVHERDGRLVRSQRIQRELGLHANAQVAVDYLHRLAVHRQFELAQAFVFGAVVNDAHLQVVEVDGALDGDAEHARLVLERRAAVHVVHDAEAEHGGAFGLFDFDDLAVDAFDDHVGHQVDLV